MLTAADMALHYASLTQGRRALQRAGALLARADAAALALRLAPDMFDAGGQLRTVAGFALRAVLPLTGRPVPDLPADLALRLAAARAALAPLTPDDFAGAAARRLRHRAGFADLDQSAADYLHLFALPNLWFHLAMAYAAMRAGGLPLGKADFDGLHEYPQGFRWE